MTFTGIPTPDHLLEPGRPLVGIASPFTNPDPITNIRYGARFATALWTRSEGALVPVLPNANLVWDMIAPLPYEAWLAVTMAVIERCDMLVRLPGESSGADLEVRRALDLNIPVLTYRDDLTTEQVIDHAHVTVDVLLRLWDEREPGVHVTVPDVIGMADIGAAAYAELGDL